MRISKIISLITFLLVIGQYSNSFGQGRPPGSGSGRPPGLGSGRPTGTTTPTTKNPNSGGDIFGRIAIKPDTFDTQHFYLENPFLILEAQDTLLDNDYAQPDPAYHGDYAFANLGNLGSPLTPLVYESKIRDRLNIGFNNFEKYYFKKEDLKFFKLNSAYTNATYSQGRTQDDQHLRVIFAKEFGKALSFTIHHHRINHAGVFPNQLARNYALNTGFWYHHPKGKYQAFFTLTSNSTLHLENGGLNSAGIAPNRGNIQQEETFPVLLSQDTTRYQMRNGGIVQYFNLRSPFLKNTADTSVLEQFPMLSRDSLRSINDSTLRDSIANELFAQDSIILSIDTTKANAIKTLDSIPIVDSLNLDLSNTGQIDSLLKDSLIDSIQIDSLLKDSLLVGKDSLFVKKRKRKKPTRFYDPNRLIPQRRQISLGHELNIFRGFYKYADLNADSSFYGNLYVYNQGLQYRVAHSGVENSFFISTTSLKQRSGNKTQQPRDFFKAGVKHSYNKFAQLKDTTNISNLSLFGKANLVLFDKLRLNASGKFFLSGYNAGDFYLNGNLNLNVGKIGELRLHALSQAFSPSVVQNKMIISGVTIWDNDFQKTVETKVGGTIQISKTGTSVGTNFQLLDNFIYHDTLGIVQQNDDVFAIPQLIIHQPIHLGIFHLENTFVLQRSNDDLFSIPNIFTKHNLYIETRIFKEKMLVRLGAQGIFHTEYKARKYQPILGQFYNSAERLDFYPQIDPYVSIKRGGFRFFVRAQNISSLILHDQLDVEFGMRTPNYPVPFRVIRFGISWMLLN